VILAGDTRSRQSPGGGRFPAPYGQAQPGGRGPKLSPHNPFAPIGSANARSGAGIAADPRPVSARCEPVCNLCHPCRAA